MTRPHLHVEAPAIHPHGHADIERLSAADIDMPELRRQLGAFVEGSPQMQRVARALEKLLAPPAGLGGQRTREMAERVLHAILSDYRKYMSRILRELDDRMGRLLDDVAAMRGSRTIEGRTPAARAEDLRELDEALKGMRTLGQHVNKILDGKESAMATKLRNDLEAGLGLRRRDAPHPAHLGGVVPPTGRRPAGRDPRFFDALERLHAAATPREVGRQVKQLLAMNGGDVKRTVQGILGAGWGEKENRAIIAVLTRLKTRDGAKRLLRRGRRRMARGDAWAVFQELVTGADREWTGQLRTPVGTRETVGIDGIVGGMVIDSKWINVPLSESPHSTGRRSFPEGQTTPDVVAEMRQSAESRGRVERAMAEKHHDVLDLMERQLQFARENGLRGVEWVCGSRELADHFEVLFAENLQGRSGGVSFSARSTGP